MNSTSIKYVILLGFLICFLACKPEQQVQGKFAVLPTPTSFKIDGVSNIKSDQLLHVFIKGENPLPLDDVFFKVISEVSSADVFVDIQADLELGVQGYQLDITKDKIQIVGHDKAGAFYGLMTLQQLLSDAKEQQVNLPMCHIVDQPKLSYRAIHLDVKHHLDKEEYYYTLIDRLALHKINGVIIEFEDKLKYTKHPLIGSQDAFSVEQWKNLAHYAKERFIEISPLVQGLGHASFILKHDQYKDLRDDVKSDWAFNPLDSATYQLQFDLYKEAIAATPHGKYLHVGGDEVHTNGRGSKLSALELQLHWLNKVCQFAEAHNRIPIFWDDMPLKNAGLYNTIYDNSMSNKTIDSLWLANEPKLTEFLDQFPKNCIYMRWNYSNPSSYGNQKTMAWYKEHNLPAMGATAAQRRWVLMPQDQGNISSIKEFAVSSINNGLDGLLLTLWDDDSPHFELYTRGILAFAEYCWAGNEKDEKQFKSLYRQKWYGTSFQDSSYAFIDQLEQPVAFWKNALLKGNSRNYLMRNANASTESVMELPDIKEPQLWLETHGDRVKKANQMLEVNQKVEKTLETILSQNPNHAYNLKVYQQVNHISKWSSEVLQHLGIYASSTDKEAKSKAVDQLKQLQTDFKKRRAELEEVYSKTRILHKPSHYILDQDHHVHLANQSLNFDWQFYAEMLFLEKLDVWLHQEQLITD